MSATMSPSTVPFLDLAAANAELREELTAAAAKVIAAERVLLGPSVAGFEADFASYVGADHAIGVGNGLDALTLGLRALGVTTGDEVIVPSHTFIATWLAVTAAGAVPVPAEVRPETGNIDPAAVEAAVTPRTAAIVDVASSGSDVPTATIVSPISWSLIPATRATPIAPSTRK